MPHRLRTLLILAAVPAWLACSGDAPGGAPSTMATDDTPISSLTVGPPAEHLDRVAREPMFAEHPSGALFLAGYGYQPTGTDPRAVPQLWRSDDGGSTWSAVDVGTAEDGAIGNSDVDLTVGPDGTIYFMSMGYDRATSEGTHIAVGVSHDAGVSWVWTLLSEHRFDDRPWVRVTPDGTAHAVWNDGSGVAYATSADRGRTWEERPRIHPEGGSSHLAVGPSGELAVRITPIAASANAFHEGVELIAVSTDGGGSWSKHPAPGERRWDPTFRDPSVIPRWVEPLAWDAAGSLYHLWSAGTEMHLARSTDRGATWQEWTVASHDGPAFFPYLVGRGAGELAATWFVVDGGDQAVRAAVIRVPELEGEPEVILAEPFQIEVFVERDALRQRDPGGEYLPIAFLDGGELGLAAPIQDADAGRFGFTFRKLRLE